MTVAAPTSGIGTRIDDLAARLDRHEGTAIQPDRCLRSRLRKVAKRLLTLERVILPPTGPMPITADGNLVVDRNEVAVCNPVGPSVRRIGLMDAISIRWSLVQRTTGGQLRTLTRGSVFADSHGGCGTPVGPPMLR